VAEALAEAALVVVAADSAAVEAALAVEVERVAD
jgi:hypothetical protein